MTYRILADAVLIAHGLFVAWVVFGGLAAFWRGWLAWLHLPALAWGATVAGMGWICPLTPLENTLRVQAGQSPYAGDFIHHYLTALIYPPALTRGTQALLAVLLLGGNAIVYTLVFRRRRHGKR
ncbi:DUF2784 domain-containing protein [Bordetella genomosp. 11]|uniref:DUF2784 domain-containing protein n=1 Tax=Bordetella genomosp. 11 TaxID=1416808 RepID=A0A261UQ56_9BORD|nr:DUF2784 domain-containing protein [Bordetella genomosp. 11]OZI63502.1 hypothetical protein CAL28_20995 [Bordetella genomosp. 11]